MGELKDVPDEEKGHARWSAAALCYGYNELAKQAKTLGDKVYFRIARDAAEQQFIALGGNKFVKEPDAIAELVVPDCMPRVRFSAADIELMRSEVAEHDAGMPWDDRPLPEDEAIKAAHPNRTDRQDLYGEAMRLVGAKRSKWALIELVNWLLTRIPEMQNAATSPDKGEA